jgi:pimeloyl-ACP methyl ester carboxylesterase
MHRHYVDTSLGQIHVTEAGDGPAVLLMHWVPLSGAFYAEELPHFAQAGYRALAVDLMGFGRSAARSGLWSVEQHATSMEELLVALGARDVTVVGGHYSTPVAVELAQSARASRHQVRALVVDGGPLMPPEAFQALLKSARVGSGPGLKDDGSHRSWLWDQAVHTYTMFAPQTFRLDESRLPRIYQFMADFIAAGMRQDMAQLQPYDFAARLRAVQLPTLVLSAETEPLRTSFEPLIACRGECCSHLFAGDHPLHDPARAGEFAGAIAAFLNQGALDSALTSRSTK